MNSATAYDKKFKHQSMGDIPIQTTTEAKYTSEMSHKKGPVSN